MKRKTIGIILILGSAYYLIGEFISALFFKDTLINTYLFHTISQLGIPGSQSPLYALMNSTFILIGLILVLYNFYTFKDSIIKNKLIFYILTIITSLGVIIVGIIHTGNPITHKYHILGAIMAILGGNILLILISQSTKEFEIYEKITLTLGIIGVIIFMILLFNTTNIYMPVLERTSVYTLIIWSFISGIYNIKLSKLE